MIRSSAAASFGRLLLVGLVAAGLAGCHHGARVYQPATAPAYPLPNAPSTTRAGRPDPGGIIAAAEIPKGSRLISDEVGLASWYGTVYDKRPSANGDVYDKRAMTAASRTLPLGVLARVTNLTTGQAAVVRITDRGPFVPGRVIDLSEGVARQIGIYQAGIGQVRVEGFEPKGYVEPAARWCVQIGAFLDPQDAVQMKNDLLRRYRGAKVIWFTGPTGSWVRLTLTVPDKTSSEEIAEEVRVPDPGVGAYVTRTN